MDSHAFSGQVNNQLEVINHFQFRGGELWETENLDSLEGFIIEDDIYRPPTPEEIQRRNSMIRYTLYTYCKGKLPEVRTIDFTPEQYKLFLAASGKLTTIQEVKNLLVEMGVLES